ncbi:uncharacterized protein TNIN_424511 [Trichonephila inaurata madagascariensis]|uniref:Uncharacterized protein n=1 Tax=Trichonephila inaurata madagascariensis TaxID=2747483 RepID=A0A8X7C6G4_9ARAC|nr:uncharacterized protein TNIN_424511 [Trichonephila inaurata madagascariensis]
MANPLGLVSRIQNILAADDQDQVKESFGATEQKIAKIVLILAALPSIIFPIVYHIFSQEFLLGCLFCDCLFNCIVFRHSIPARFNRVSLGAFELCMNTSFGNFQCPFRNETRHVWTLDNQAQVYTFAHPDGTYCLVFEWEYGAFSKPIKVLDTEPLLENLGKYWKVYEYFRSFSPPPYRINETLSRRSVTCIANFQGLQGVVAQNWIVPLD